MAFDAGPALNCAAQDPHGATRDSGSGRGVVDPRRVPGAAHQRPAAPPRTIACGGSSFKTPCSASIWYCVHEFNSAITMPAELVQWFRKHFEKQWGRAAGTKPVPASDER